ncbi:SET domain-containing protein [Auriscalpium vulgare]|uniref:SET domain-containing protein n=1 Tax=Auriscalpium vulgare TaxID=40419 RepID=A0ACB8RX92_9AGAM|nr:SET domain-containing protein [Auriscalpium vulgare]
MATPADEELRSAVLALREQHPVLGISKFHALLLEGQPGWSVSEKRMRRFLPAPPTTTPLGRTGEIYPSSRLIDDLELEKWTGAVEVKLFDKKKGKGLIAKRAIAEGETVWKEDPFVIAPEWDIYDLVYSSRACGSCTTPLTDSPLVLPCPASSSSTFCPIRFCNRLCLSRSTRTHPLVCAAQNPSCVPLLAFARRTEWLALHALTQCAARMMLAPTAGARKADWTVFEAFAVLSMEERAKSRWYGGAEPDRAAWQNAHQLYVQAFRPSSPAAQKKFARLVKLPLPDDIADALFSYDGFLAGLGRMSLNLEAHGGLYTLHSHLNHDCTPNISVRHLDQRTALSRITLIARRDISAGEELVVTYVYPELGVRERRGNLGAWGFGECQCERCKREENDPDVVSIGTQADMHDLERELKAGLGVL